MHIVVKTMFFASLDLGSLLLIKKNRLLKENKNFLIKKVDKFLSSDLMN